MLVQATHVHMYTRSTLLNNPGYNSFIKDKHVSCRLTWAAVITVSYRGKKLTHKHKTCTVAVQSTSTSCTYMCMEELCTVSSCLAVLVSASSCEKQTYTYIPLRRAKTPQKCGGGERTTMKMKYTVSVSYWRVLGTNKTIVEMEDTLI